MNLKINDHHITLFYLINNKVNPAKLSYETLIKTGLPDELLNRWVTKGNKKLAKQSIWKKINDYDLSRNLVPAIHQLFHKEDDDEQAIINTFQLKDGAVNLLNGEHAQNQDKSKIAQLTLSCNSKAQKRLESTGCEQQPELYIENILYHQFKTGSGVVCINLQLLNNNLSTTLINETVYSLSKINALCWQQISKGFTCSTQTTMGKMIRQLLDNEDEFQATRRVYSNTYIQYKKDEADKTSVEEHSKRLELDLIRLSKHYNLSYKLNLKNTNVRLFKALKDVRHCIANEGLSTFVILDNQSDDFMQDYYNRVIKPSHQPLYLLAYHAKGVIQNILNKNAQWLDNQKVVSQKLKNFQFDSLKLLNLDLSFFNPIISSVDTHNQIHNALIEASQIEKQHQKATQLTETIVQMIISNNDQQRQEAAKQLQQENKTRNREYCKIAQLGVAAAAYFTSFTLIKEGILEVIIEEGSFAKTSVLLSIIQNHTGAISLVGSIFVSVIVYAIAHEHCEHANKE